MKIDIFPISFYSGEDVLSVFQFGILSLAPVQK